MTQRQRTIFLLLVCLAEIPLFYLHARLWMPRPYWDAAIYAEALSHFSRGESPYVLAAGHQFVYPPIFILIGNWLSRLLTPTVGWKLYLAVHMASVVAMPIVIARFYLRRLGKLEALLAFLAAPFTIAEMVFILANISPLCYCSALLAAVPGVSSNRWRWFYGVTVLAACVKISFLVLLLLPLMVGVGQLLPSVITASTTFAFYLLQKICFPNLYWQFRAALARQTFGGRDYGTGVLGATANLLKRLHVAGLLIPEAVWIVFATAIVLILYRLRRHLAARDERFLALVLIAIILVNPRMVGYDTTTALVPAYFLLVFSLHRGLTRLLLAFNVAGFFIGHGDVGFLLLFISAFIVGVKSLKDSPKQLDMPQLAESAI